MQFYFREFRAKDFFNSHAVIAYRNEGLRWRGWEIRTTSYLLHPPLLDECGLALLSLVGEMRARQRRCHSFSRGRVPKSLVAA